MKMSIAHCYFIAIEFVIYARTFKSLLKEYRLDAPRIPTERSFQILRPAIFMENLQVFVRAKIYSIIIHSSGEMRVNLRDHFKINGECLRPR